MSTQAGQLGYSSIGKDITYNGVLFGEIVEVTHDSDSAWITYLYTPEDVDNPAFSHLVLLPDDLVEIS